MTNHLCGECEIGGYEGQVELVPPPFLSRADGRGICIDVCLALEISRLWAHGIKTNGCCCGHGRANPFISVAHGFEGSMRDLGYTVQSHPMRPGAGDHFWPKTGLSTPQPNVDEGDGK